MKTLSNYVAVSSFKVLASSLISYSVACSLLTARNFDSLKQAARTSASSLDLFEGGVARMEATQSAFVLQPAACSCSRIALF